MNEITNNPTYKQILKDSFGGVMYNVANRHKYDTAELLKTWEALSPSEREASGGIAKGLFHFITEEA